MEDESFTDITTTKSLASFTISTDNEASERLKKQKESLVSKQNSRARVPSWYATDVKGHNEEKAVQTSAPKTPTAPRTPKPSIRLRSGNEKNVEHSEESSETNVSPIVDSPPKSSLWSRWGGGSSANPKWKGSNGSIPMTPTLSDGIGFKDSKYKPKDSSQEPKRVIWRDIYAEVIPNTSCFHSQRGDAHEAKVVLNQVSGYADPGQLTYIMGTSGSGKTTLLNILTQKRDDSLRVYGDIAINDCLLEAGDMKKISAYVQHEDLFITNVTVQEHLMFAARLRAHAKKTDDERKEIVEGVIQAMNLGNCRNTKIGGALQKNLSGGERKRLAFATEILADPSILFCDEPTSGLDSAMALRVALALKMLASKGKTVISTIHQPSSQVYEMADRLILLTHGQITYQGNASQVGDFFSSCGYPSPKFTSLPDHFIKVLSKDDDITEEEYTNRIKHLVDSYEASEEGKLAHHMTHMFTVTSTEQKARLIPGSDDKYSASWFAQLWWLFLRSSKIMLRDRQGFLTRLTKTIIISFISGLIYFNTKFTKDTLMNHKGAAIHAVSDMSYIYLYLSIYVLVNDLPAVIREYQANTYAPSAYFLAVVLADSVQYLIHPTIYSLIIYLMAGYSRSFSQYLLFNLLNITVANVSTSVAYAAASICGRLTIAVIFVPMVINSSLIFAGFFIDLRTIPVYFAVLPHLSWFKYAYEAYMIVLLKPIEEIDGCPSENPYDATVCSAKNGVEVHLLAVAPLEVDSMEDEGQPNFHRMESEATRTSEALSTFAPSTKVSPTQMETKSEQTDSNLSTVVMSVAVDSSTQSDSEQESKEGDRLLWREIYAETVPERSLLGFGRAKYSSEAKLILNRVSGYADPGQVTFIMGASGAGKSTLLNILTQKKTEGIKFSGDVAINGSLVEWGDMKKLSAYVQQEDLFIGQATVEEQLMFTARLRMRDKRTNEERKAIVSEALTAMGLTECRKTQIGNALVKSLSKGERKRLAFATEILSNPRILFCDEPTSGLDSFMSLQIVVALKMFASQGKTVVTTIHQPSSQVYEMADRLILMANGEVAFQGNASEVGEFLNEYCASWCTQTWWLFVRSSRSLVRNPVVVVVRLVQVFAISMILGLIYFQSSFTKDSLMNYKGAALRATADMTYIFLFPCVYLFIAELPVVIREYQSHTYAPSAYFIGTSMASVLQYIIFPTMYSFILYLLAGYSGTVSQFCLFNLLNIVVANLAASVAYAAACIFGNQEMAVTFLPLILKPLFVFAGFLIDLRTVPIYFKPLTYISWYKYAYEAHLIILLNPIDTIPGCPSSKESDAMICSAKNGDEVLNLLGFDSNYFWINFAILLFILFFLRGLALVVFSLRIRHS